MMVLGTDPGFGTCGLALLDEDGQRWKPALLETVRTPPSWRLPARLHAVWRHVGAVITESKPTPAVLAVEAQARAQAGARERGQSSDDALAVREVMGLLRALAWQHGLAFVEVEPATWRSCLGLRATADKAHVQRVVRAMLGWQGRLSQHAADAAAIAIAGARYFRSYAVRARK